MSLSHLFTGMRDRFPHAQVLRHGPGDLDSVGDESTDSDAVYYEDGLHMPGSMPALESYPTTGHHIVTDRSRKPEYIHTSKSRLVERLSSRPMEVEPRLSAQPDDPFCPSPTRSPQCQNRQRDEELWYPDGNIILIANGIEFRVYQGPLTDHSRVFKDMLTMPQPPSSDTPGGSRDSSCVAINLTDSPEDLRHFLRVFVGKSFAYASALQVQGRSIADIDFLELCSYGGFHPAYHEISACIRLADKYECDQLMQRCLDYLKRYFHDNFDWWKDDAAVFAPPKFDRIHCIGVVNLARLTGQDKILPGALMGCCQLGTEIADGFVREDGTREMLSAEDLARCFVGKAKLVEWNTRATLRILHQDVHEECKQAERCRAMLLKMLKGLEDSNVLYSLRWDWSWMPWLDQEDSERELCRACYAMVGKNGRQKEQQRVIFDQLPSLMQVEVKHWGKTDDEIARIEAEEAAAVAAAAAASEAQGQGQTQTDGAGGNNGEDDDDDEDDDEDSDEESNSESDTDDEGEDGDA